MGTRHIIKIYDQNGVLKVNQYGQWDGYIEGQGVQILDILSDNDNIAKIKGNIDRVSILIADTEDEQYVLAGENRDEGSDTLFKIINLGVEDYLHIPIAPKEWLNYVEYTYVINFNDNVFYTYADKLITQFSLDELPIKSDYIAINNYLL